MKLTIYWRTLNKEYKKAIQEKFNIPKYVSVNGETDCDIREQDLPLLKETARRGFIDIRIKPNGSK